MDLSNISWFLQTYSPATIEEVAKVEAELSLQLPDVYKYFLARSNGASANLAALYDTDSLIEMNRAYLVTITGLPSIDESGAQRNRISPGE